MSDEPSLEVWRGYRETYLKLMDLFETRQTWAFSFAALTYTGCIGSVASLMTAGWGTRFAQIMALVFGIGLPLLVLPLCSLYVDASAYCAALHAGNRRHLKEDVFKSLKSAPQFQDPAYAAYSWLTENLQFEQKLHSAAKVRLVLFWVAPCLGFVVSTGVLVWCVGRGAPPMEYVLPGIGAISSALVGIQTWKLCAFVVEARGIMAEEIDRR